MFSYFIEQKIFICLLWRLSYVFFSNWNLAFLSKNEFKEKFWLIPVFFSWSKDFFMDSKCLIFNYSRNFYRFLSCLPVCLIKCSEHKTWFISLSLSVMQQKKMKFVFSFFILTSLVIVHYCFIDVKHSRFQFIELRKANRERQWEKKSRWKDFILW